MVCVIINGNSVPHEEELIKSIIEVSSNIKSILINSNKKKTNVVTGKDTRVIWGRNYIIDELCDLKFKISPLSFYQVNRSQAEKLYNIAKEYASLNKNDVLLDLYCGAGTIGLSMAHDVKNVIGIEIVEEAIKDAKENAMLNNIKNATFMCADASEAAITLSKKGVKPDVIIIDPPRKGCSESVIETIVNMSPSRIVYISCNPATLARDLKLFNEKNYKLEIATPVDLFPRTHHVETVVLMSKVNS